MCVQSQTPIVAMTYSSPDISIVVMAFNEGESLEGVVRDIASTFDSSPWRCETIIVDDGSTDSTGKIADELTRELPGVSVIHHVGNRGIGEVYASGFSRSRGTWITFLPADGQFSASTIVDFARLTERVDLVLGFLPEQAAERNPLGRMLSGTEKALFRLMFGRLPRFQGVMMFRRSLLNELSVTPRGRSWGVLTELIVKSSRAGKAMVSVPTELRARKAGSSKVNNVRTIWANLQQAIALRVSLR